MSDNQRGPAFIYSHSLRLFTTSFVNRACCSSFSNPLTSPRLPLSSFFFFFYLLRPLSVFQPPLHLPHHSAATPPVPPPPGSRPLNERAYLSLIGLRANRNKQWLHKYRGELLLLARTVRRALHRAASRGGEKRAEARGEP